MSLAEMQFKQGGWGRGLAAGALLIALATSTGGCRPSSRAPTGSITRWRRSPRLTCRSWPCT